MNHRPRISKTQYRRSHRRALCFQRQPAPRPASARRSRQRLCALPKTTWQQSAQGSLRGRAAAIELCRRRHGRQHQRANCPYPHQRLETLPVLREELWKGDHDFITNDLMFADREVHRQVLQDVCRRYRRQADQARLRAAGALFARLALRAAARQPTASCPRSPEFVIRLSSTRELCSRALPRQG